MEHRRRTPRRGSAAGLAAGHPHILGPDLLQPQKLPAARAGHLANFVGGDAHPAPGVVLAGVGRQPVDVDGQNTARLEDAPGFVQVTENHFAAGDVLEHGVGVDEVEARVRERCQVRAGAVMRKRVGHAGQPFPRQADHLVGDIDAVDFGEMPAHGAHQASRAAADFERGLARLQGAATRAPGEAQRRRRWQRTRRYPGCAVRRRRSSWRPRRRAGSNRRASARVLRCRPWRSCYSNVYGCCLSWRHCRAA